MELRHCLVPLLFCLLIIYILTAKQTSFFSYIKNLNKLEIAAEEKTLAARSKSVSNSATCVYAVCSCISTLLSFTVAFWFLHLFHDNHKIAAVTEAFSIISTSALLLFSYISRSQLNVDRVTAEFMAFVVPLLSWEACLVSTHSTWSAHL